MKIDVFDTYAYTSAGPVLHFDVLVPHGTTKETAFGHAQAFLDSIGVAEAQLKSMRCDFCHSEMANTALEALIKKDGHFILQMEGCPNPH